MIKKVILAAILLATPAFGQEIKLIQFNWNKGNALAYSYDPIRVQFTSGGGIAGIYIIEIEGQKYIVNAAGGIIKHEPKEIK